MNQIKTSSWHWMYANRFKKIRNYRNSISICAYFWRVFFSVLLSAILIIVTPSTLVATIYHITSLIQFGQYGLILPSESLIAFILFLVGTIVFTLGWMAIAFFSFVFGISAILTGIEYLYNKRKLKSSDNILTAYISAKKNKWCPMLEIKRDNG